MVFIWMIAERPSMLSVLCHASSDLIAICDGNDEECIEPANTHPDDNDPADWCDIRAKCDDNDEVCTKPVNINSGDNDLAAHLKTFRCKYAKNLIISHYNIKSIRYKFSELQHILHGNLIDNLCMAETKIDASFFDGHFQVNIYKSYRQDRNDRGGGIMMYINDNIPYRLLKQFSGIDHGIDYLTFEIIVKSRKWYISYLYRPPKVNESILCDLLNVLSEEFISNNNLYVAYGDHNCNWFKLNALSDLCEIYGMVHLIWLSARWALHSPDNHQRIIFHALCLVKLCALYICWKIKLLLNWAAHLLQRWQSYSSGCFSHKQTEVFLWCM